MTQRQSAANLDQQWARNKWWVKSFDKDLSFTAYKKTSGVFYKRGPAGILTKRIL
jgi:hypothetical protein